MTAGTANEIQGIVSYALLIVHKKTDNLFAIVKKYWYLELWI